MSSQQIQTRQLKANEINPESFLPYGQLITPSEDGKPYDENDAQLNLENGIPRFYLMRLYKRGRKFRKITRHSQCTQCLGSLGAKDWFLAVAPPCALDVPDLNHLAVFHIPGNCFIKLEVGTWHAGPYFDHDFVDFYNLELADTNIVDHFTYDFSVVDHLQFEIIFPEDL